MKIAVIGGGTAGYMAAAHISKFFPDYELYHIYDSNMPTIGVGEGTLPGFPEWLHAVTELDFEELQKAAHITHKIGVQFEQWGKLNNAYNHNFARERYGYHISATEIIPLLQTVIKGTHLNKKVTALHSTGRAVNIQFKTNATKDNANLNVDFAFDATGFPKTLTNEHIPLKEIPTNAALIRSGPVNSFNQATRGVARPHGWIFVIPLTTRTAYGYIYNNNISTKSAVQADFDLFLEQEKVKPTAIEKSLGFPNFIHSTFFDGSLFKIGNAASFMEPLEATALHVVLTELRFSSYWLSDTVIGARGEERWNPAVLRILNQTLIKNVRLISLFVGWHYAKGSVFNTPFWEFAQTNFEKAFNQVNDESLISDFEKTLQAGKAFPPKYLPLIKDKKPYDELIYPKLIFPTGSSGIVETSFAQVGYGIGYF